MANIKLNEDILLFYMVHSLIARICFINTRLWLYGYEREYTIYIRIRNNVLVKMKEKEWKWNGMKM